MRGAKLLRETAVDLGDERIELAQQVEQIVIERLAERSPDRALAVDVEFYAAVGLEAVGLPASLFTPTFALSRAVGWSAHALEEASDNRIMRPSSRCVCHRAWRRSLGRSWQRSQPFWHEYRCRTLVR